MQKTHSKIRTAITISLCLLLVCAENIHAKHVLHIAVASHFRAHAQYISKLFTVQSGIPVKITSNSSGAIYAQIINGAPYHIFLSADASLPEQLDNRSLAIKVASYTRGRLSIGSSIHPLSKDNTGYCIPNDLIKTLSSTRQIAIANPKLAPYGKAAKASLSNLTKKDGKHRLLYANNAAQSLQYALLGHADFSLTAKSLILQHNSKHKPIYSCDLPEKFYPDIIQKYAVLYSDSNNEAMSFINFLSSKSIQLYLQQSGFGPIYNK